MLNEYIVSGTMFYGDDPEVREGYLVIRDGKIKEVCFERHEGGISGVICPAFINSHSHVGDSLAKDLPYMPLVDLVAPPDGLKHKILASASREDIADGIRSTLRDMERTGTWNFIDFRENGVEGVRLLRELAGPRAFILGRATLTDTIDDVLKVSDGVGISGANDIPRETLYSTVEKAKKLGKTVGIHAGELNRSDVDTAIDIMPDFLVHMTQAIGADIKRVSEQNIPVIVCPRSNMITGVGMPPLKKMAEAGVSMAIGTDNVMLNSPNVFSEMEWVSKAFLHDDAYTLKMATINGAKIMGREKTTGSIEAGKDADILVFDRDSDNLRGSRNILSSIVRRGRPDDIIYSIHGGIICQKYSTRS
ncbi:amidohydrolase [Methanocella sp. CWC-04]|uniref:Amidohydrolase n=1 Tax=Methanooceanicella nereidis TaxID=2052831 RepID=A0AAP2W4Z6_9EURY|nr:amidohydrolase family protein [Methanocella sp. CWC-04]MCD1294930.1 amidohydrolase [Methanocella sp. CWC-04]